MMKKVIIDCERMKYPHTGLYHYCLQLGKALLKNADPANESLAFYVRPAEQNIFGSEANYFPHHSLHKFVMPNLRNYDIWHSTYHDSYYYPFSKKIKIVLTIHDLNFMHEGRDAVWQQKELKKLQRKINRADHVVTISEFTLQDVQKHLDLSGKAHSVIYNGCNITGMKLEKPQQMPGEKFIYTIGSINAKKNFHVLPTLIANNDYMLVISGVTDDENYKEKILAEAAACGVSAKILFTGAVSENDKQWYMQNCEAFVFPSLAEGFGLPVIEAMYFGKPVISSACTSLPEIGGDAAYYFQNFEAQHMQKVLAESLEHYKSTPGIMEKIQKRAAFFNWDDTAKKYLDVYRSLV